MKAPTLVILAAGLASRYGSSKQTDGFGPNNSWLMDYAIYDALQVGFNQIVIIIQQQMLPIFTQKYIEDLKLPVSFAIQEPTIFFQNKTYTRTKPWGTAHALYCAKPFIDSHFVIINADDFYGRHSYQLAFTHLTTQNSFCNIGFKAIQTLSQNGTVNRAELIIENQYLTATYERQGLFLNQNQIEYSHNNSTSTISPNALVSMNMWGATPILLTEIEHQISNFLLQNFTHNSNAEFLIPDVINHLIQYQKAKVKVIPTPESWFGATYPADKPYVKTQLATLVSNHIYPKKLF
jgi:hypothetical protein